MKILFTSLGCDKNLVDTEHMLGLLAGRGYEMTDDETEADVIIVNTCCFIHDAREESISGILEMAGQRKNGRCRALVVTGCLAQRYGQEILDEIPEVDAVLGTNSYGRLPQVLDGVLGGSRELVMEPLEGLPDNRGKRVMTTGGHYEYLKIAEGCDKHCTYCVIPSLRGSYRSVPMEELLEEARRLAEDGVKELILVAQETTVYGKDLYGKKSLHVLLKKLCEIPGLSWIRVLYCYPDTVNETLLDAIERLPKVCKYMDLPLQHIDGKLLKEMNRRGSPEYIRELIQSCHRRGISVRTTMIVGFPGETDEQFETLERFVQEARFDRMGAFTYSAEEGTPAAGRSDQIPEEVKQSRLDRLMTLQQRISLEANQARVGEVAEVLVEGYDQGRYYGRSRMEAPEIDGKIWFKSQKELKPGEYVSVEIMEAYEYDLSGEAMV